MAGRPCKNNADYFSHSAQSGKEIFLLERKFGNDGYATWFKLLELLTLADGHYYDFSGELNRLYLIEKCLITEDKVLEIIQLLVDLNLIDRELWEKTQVIWVQTLVDTFHDLYVNSRKKTLPTRPSYLLSGVEIAQNVNFSPSIPEYSREMPQSKVKESILKEKERKDIEQKTETEKTEKTEKDMSDKKSDDIAFKNLQTEQTNNDTVETTVKEKKALSKKQKLVYTVSFEELWELYPRKTNKKLALQAFSRIAPNDELLEVIKQSVIRWVKTDQWNDMNYIPHLTTFLNGERWADIVPQPKQVKNNSNEPDFEKYEREYEGDRL